MSDVTTQGLFSMYVRLDEEYQVLVKERVQLNVRIKLLEAENAKLYAAHAEWSRNDCRTFGDLLLRIKELE